MALAQIDDIGRNMSVVRTLGHAASWAGFAIACWFFVTGLFSLCLLLALGEAVLGSAPDGDDDEGRRLDY